MTTPSPKIAIALELPETVIAWADEWAESWRDDLGQSVTRTQVIEAAVMLARDRPTAVNDVLYEITSRRAGE